MKPLKLERATSVGGSDFDCSTASEPTLLMIDEEAPRPSRHSDLFQALLQHSEHAEQPLSSAETTCSWKPAFPETQTMEVEASESGSRQGCKCSKIGCLKLYCECFARGLTCGKGCVCTGCENCLGNEKKIRLAQEMANFRKPGSFQGVKAYVPERRCTCKKSQCLKKYCQCHNSGLRCSASCLCTDCHNRDPVEPFERSTLQMEIEVKG